ncbi:hypothetical protein [Rhodanobacter lindaniclasticus]
MSARKIHALETSLKAWLAHEVGRDRSSRKPVILTRLSVSTLQRYRQQLRHRLDAAHDAGKVARKLIH